VQSPFLRFSIDLELIEVRTLLAMVANLTFMKPGCENMAFFNVFSFFSKTKKEPGEI